MSQKSKGAVLAAFKVLFENWDTLAKIGAVMVAVYFAFIMPALARDFVKRTEFEEILREQKKTRAQIEYIKARVDILIEKR